MKINVHAHVFNFPSILTKETILVLSHRLSGKNLPEPLRDAILSYLRTRRRSRPGDMSFDDFHRTIRPRRVFGRLIPGSLRGFFDRHLDLPPSAETAAVLNSLLEASLIDRHQARSSTVINAFEWLRIGFMKSIDSVTDDLMTHMDEDDVTVVLPMDILDKNADKKDLDLFITQMQDTKRQALRYPGRVLPFAKVNPLRKESFKLMRESVESGACVGLKLYPSLGYKIQGGVMDDVLRYCDQHDLPVLQHCNDKGFRKSPKDAQFCNPRHWIPVLDSLPGIKICFAHFGGQSQNGKPVWTRNPMPEESWASDILEMMGQYPGRVYADVSYHSEQNDTPEATKNYRKNILAVLSDDRYRKQVLWGTDFHLLRMDSTDTDYTSGFRTLTDIENFDLISQHNPADFLGLPVFGKTEGRNIARHVAWLAENHARAVHGKPASWLLEHSGGTEFDGDGNISAKGTAWDLNNRIHTSVFNFIWNSRHPEYLHQDMKNKMRRQGEQPEALFEAMGRLPVGELTFLSDILADRTDRDQAIRSFSNRIYVQFTRIRDFERTGSADSEYYRRMASVCSIPENTVPQIAKVMEQFFKLKTDLVTDQ